ncbi:MAG: hypothetical protein ACT4O2_08180 [Beijerinckiaceae bacterium]
MDIASVKTGTGKAWRDWLAFLEKIDAHSLPHKEIARRVREECNISGWWAQSIAVAYEQHIGRRAPGQQCDGSFQVSVSRTFPGSMDSLLARWQMKLQGRRQLSGVAIARGPDVTSTDKWRYWRCGLADGSRVSAGIGARQGGKAVLGIGHENLDSPEAIERWRAFWKEELAGL